LLAWAKFTGLATVAKNAQKLVLWPDYLSSLSEAFADGIGDLHNKGKHMEPMKKRTRLCVELLESRELLDATSDLGFLQKAYQDLLHRPMDPSGQALFSNALANGSTDRAGIVLAIEASPEFQTLQLQTVYQNLLGRNLDAGGQGTFGPFLAAGGTIEQVSALVAGSDEFFQTQGGSNNDGFLSALYQDLLQRPIDPTGQAVFTQELNSGVTRFQVAMQVISSGEAVTDEVQGFYQQYLGRAADSTGLSMFVGAIQAGVPSTDVVAAILSSSEYYANPNSGAASTADLAAANSSTLTITAPQVQALLQRAAAASSRNDAIIAIVDRQGRVLGVRMEAGVAANIQTNPVLTTFAVDGALAEARTGAFFGNNQAPLTSRTIQYISQSTITQREVESNPDTMDPTSTLYGPGVVAPIGMGAHFPPKVEDTPTVDLKNIEFTNRDSIIHPGADGNLSPTDYIQLPNRFNIPSQYIPPGQQDAPPESYGLVSGIDPFAQARGIGTLPGGIPIVENGQIVGGIGVFFPGTSGFSDSENSALSSNYDPTKPDLSFVAEWMAFAALGGSKTAGVTVGTLGGVAPLTGFDLPFGRIDLVGVQLDIFGPGGTQGVYTLQQFGATLGTRSTAGDRDLPVDLGGDPYLDGDALPSGWLVTPHDGTGLTAADVVQIITQGIAQANNTRAAIRLPSDQPTKMIFSVSDLNGNILGLYRMPDATTFSIDVAVAKSRNTAYLANPALVQSIDLPAGVPAGAAIESRTIRYLALPDFPEGINQAPPGPYSIINDGGTDKITGLNTGAPLPATAFTSVEGHDVFHPGTNFHDPLNPANQNGIVFFPGGVPLYKTVNGVQVLVGGLGVSGDGVDQDDVVTFAASQGFTAPSNLTADNFFVNGVRLPYQKFDRNPEG
jgi:uncharacterized protein GlcG (DUF336 family)